jgi:hypothetical protein
MKTKTDTNPKRHPIQIGLRIKIANICQNICTLNNQNLQEYFVAAIYPSITQEEMEARIVSNSTALYQLDTLHLPCNW